MARAATDRWLMGLTRTQLREALQILAVEHPAAHPYTLALLLEARTGSRISGALARELLSAGTERTAG